MAKKKTILKIAAASAAGLLLTGSLAVSSLTLYNQLQVTHAFQKLMGNVEDPAQEDNVLIGDNYAVKSTTQISDAYRSGDVSQLSSRDKETLAMAKEVLDKIIKDDMTDYQKEIAVYQYLTADLTGTKGILTVINNGDGENYEPHDVLKNRSAVCVGYATTFRLFMQMLGIDCMVVHSSDLTHTWNLVKLDDGCWYHTDCYMDSEASNFMNFNMDDRAALQSHDWNRDFFPAASGKKYNYMLSVCEELGNLYDVPKWVMESIKAKKTAVSCTFKTPIGEKDVNLAKYMAEAVQEQLESTGRLYVQYQWILNDEGQYVLCYYFQYDSSNSMDLDEKTREKVDDKIYSVFDKYDFYSMD